jgi:hypothetical protein
MTAADPRLEAFAVCKQHAALDGAFSEALMLFWFNACWERCAEQVGLIYPPREIREDVQIDPRTGAIRLSHEPSSAVQFFAGGRLVATLAPNSPCFGPHRHWLCCPNLCCYCGCLRAVYMVGQDFGCDGVPSSFVMAVARLFAYTCENRGDVQHEGAVLAKSGALTFLSAGTKFVA